MMIKPREKANKQTKEKELNRMGYIMMESRR